MVVTVTRAALCGPVAFGQGGGWQTVGYPDSALLPSMNEVPVTTAAMFRARKQTRSIGRVAGPGRVRMSVAQRR